MTHTAMTVERVQTVLRETPRRLVELTDGATPAQLRAAPGSGEWSAAEVLAHLRSCADMWGQAIEAIVTESHPTIKAVNPRTWIESTDYRELEFRPSLKLFTRQRSRLLEILESLPQSGWFRTASVIGAGRPLERTALDYGDRLARHERAHWKQVERTMRAILE